ncbi:MAG: hypothetical protein Fur0034_12420 [Desulfuromonadia bacterium]
MFFYRLKHREVTVFKRKNVRGMIGGLLGIAAGMSLTTTIIPTVVTTVVGGEHFFIRFALADYFAHTALVWGAAGWAAGRVGAYPVGAAIMGIVGGVSGVLLAMASLGSTIPILASSAGGAMIYGAIGGLIISGIMPGDNEELLFNWQRRIM